MQDMRSDAEIVQAVLGGDVNAFEALVLRYQKKVYNTVLRLTGDSVQAEDLSQEVFLKIFRGLSSFRGESSFSTYIYRVAANTAIDALRRREAPTVSLSAENEEGEEFELALPDPALCRWSFWRAGSAGRPSGRRLTRCPSTTAP